MTSPDAGAGSAAALPDYAPIPRSALGPALNDQGYYVGRVERNLYWVTDGVYHSAFLTTPDGVFLEVRGPLRPWASCRGRSRSVTASRLRRRSSHPADGSGDRSGGQER